jgi:hypothetical protein
MKQRPRILSELLVAVMSMKGYKMKTKTKTCGECRFHHQDYHYCKADKECKSIYPENPACENFTPKVITNSDKIWQGGDEALIDFADGIRKRMCHYCIFFQEKSCVDKTNDCWDGVRNWLKQEAKDERK